MSLRWQIAMFCFNAAETAAVVWYLHRRLGQKDRPLLRIAVGFVLQLLPLFLLSIHEMNEIVKMIAFAAVVYGYALFACGGTAAQKAVQVGVAALLLSAVGWALILIFPVIVGGTFDQVMAMEPVRMEARITSRILFVHLLYFFVWRRTKTDRLVPVGNWVIAVVLPLIGMCAVCAIARHDFSHNAQQSMALFLASASVLALYVTVLVLFDHLSGKAEKVFEQEMQLRQLEQQSKYFQEIQLAAENIRGFKHDINNHLQVLGSLLDMGRTEEAGHYIAEISDFVRANDVAVASGHPLVDAVLGSKLAAAKRLGMEIDYSVDMPGELALNTMELCSLLGNLLDNAIEACGKINPLGVDRYIFLAIGYGGRHLHIAVKNSREEQGDDSAGCGAARPGRERGIGLVNVRRIVERYAGSIQIDESAHEFSVKILLPYQ